MRLELELLDDVEVEFRDDFELEFPEGVEVELPGDCGLSCRKLLVAMLC